MGNSKEKIELIKKSFELKSLKKYKEAIEALYKALEYDDITEDNIELMVQIGELYVLLGNLTRALEEFNKVLNLNKNHKTSKQRCFEIYFDLKQYNKALNLAQKMCEEEKNSINYHNYLKTLIAIEKKQDALELFNSLDEEIKLDCEILFLISQIDENKKKVLLEKIIELDYENEKANLELAKLEFFAQNYDKTVQYCLNLPNSDIAQYFLAMIEFKKKNHTRSLEFFASAIKLNPNKDYYFDLAKVYCEISWFDEALIALKKSINLSINNNNIENLDEKYLISAWILIKQNKFSQAFLNLNSIDVSSKIYSQANILKQVINVKNSDFSKAKIELEKYLQTDKNNLILLDTLAHVYKELKLYKKAIETYKSALELNSSSIFYNLEIIDLYIDEKDYDSAFKIIAEIKEKYPNCASIYNSLARIYYRLKDLDNALLNIDEYLKLDKNSAEANYFKGLILNDRQAFEQAINSIYLAININPNVAKYYSQMAKSYVGIEEYKNALLYAKEAVELDPNEINYKKQIYEIALLIKDENLIKMYLNQLQRSEKILKLSR